MCVLKHMKICICLHKHRLFISVFSLLLFLFFSKAKHILEKKDMGKNNNQKTPLLTHLVAGGTAGFMEACTCHPLDTIKVRMQLSKSGARGPNVSYISLLLI